MLTFTDKCEMIRYDYPPLPKLNLPNTFEVKDKKKKYLSDYFNQGKVSDIRNFFKVEKDIRSLFSFKISST